MGTKLEEMVHRTRSGKSRKKVEEQQSTNSPSSLDFSSNTFPTTSATKEEEWRTDWKSIYIVTLVAFIGAVHQNCIMVWPYLQLLDRNVSETFYGLLRSVSGLGSVSSALLAGWISNLLCDTKWPMVFGKVMAILSCTLYMGIEVHAGGRQALFILFEFFLGVSVGAANIYRAHIAMASTEKDRPKAVGICSLAPALGLLVGPMIQLFFTVLKYPGIPFLFGTHINLFTAPILLTMGISIVGLLLLLFQFHGHMRKPDDPRLAMRQESYGTAMRRVSCAVADAAEIAAVVKAMEIEDMEGRAKSKSEAQGGEGDGTNVAAFDWIPVVICTFTKIAISLTVINLVTVGPPYIMMVFRWTSAEAVRYQSIVLGLVALHIIVWNLAYIFLDLRRRVSERRMIVFSIFLLLCSMLATYPWPFINNTIEYQPLPDTSNDTAATTSSSASSLQGVEVLGCPHRFNWCAWTPAVNMPIFLGSLILALGVAIPLSQINLDILYSKVLSGIKQGTMQGVFIACGDGLNIALPLTLSEVYTLAGPIYIWQAVIVVQALCILSWILFYPRMVSNTIRIKRIQTQQLIATTPASTSTNGLERGASSAKIELSHHAENQHRADGTRDTKFY